MSKSTRERSVVREKTEKYRKTKRESANKKYKTKYEAIVNDFDIKENIIYQCQYAPLFFANLTIDEIEAIASREDIVSIGYYEESFESDTVSPILGDYDHCDFSDVISEDDINQLELFLEIAGVTKLKEESYLSGYNVSIGMMDFLSIIFDDYYLPDSRCYRTEYFTSPLPKDNIYHSMSAALMMAGTCGIASSAKLYAREVGNATMYLKEIDELIKSGVSVINLSLGYPGNKFSYLSDYTDYLVSNYSVMIIAGAGNMDKGANDGSEIVLEPANGDNVIAVGAYDNLYTADKTDDIMMDYSSYIEQNECLKPDLVAPANVLCTGTSIAAPVVSGTVALMLECRPSLALHPEIIKAILMASCQYKALPYYDDDEVETMSQGLTDKQGSGVFDPYLALCITSNGNYGYGILTGEEDSRNVKFLHSPYDATGMNVSIAWLKNNFYDINENVTKPGERKNLDLFLVKDGISVGSSTNLESSAEMIYSENITSENILLSEYKFNIIYNYDELDDSDEFVYYGYAWCSDSEEYAIMHEDEGLYFIKNNSQNKYLTLNYKTKILNLSNYFGSFCYDEYDQLFVISDNNGYKLSDAFTCSDGISVNGSNVTYTSYPSDIIIVTNMYGEKLIHADSRFLNYDNRLSWTYLDDLNGKEFWTFDKVCYRRGDVQMDGDVDIYDLTYLVNLYNGVYNPTNAEIYLGNLNGHSGIDEEDIFILRTKLGL